MVNSVVDTTTFIELYHTNVVLSTTCDEKSDGFENLWIGRLTRRRSYDKI